jgi:KUP system potassium uptake protein
MQLGYSPRLTIEHTSVHEKGQIFIPEINWALMVACIALVVGFGSSSNLAAAYGVAVTTTMVITTLLFYVVARNRWGWSLMQALGLSALFIVVDLAFWLANLVKIPDGGWFPLAVAAGVFLLMTTWKKGRTVLYERMKSREVPVSEFIESIRAHPPHRVPGTAVFMYGDPAGTPRALLHNLKHNQVLHERVVLLAVETEEVPHVMPWERATVVPRGEGFTSIILHYGFMDDVDVPRALQSLEGQDDLHFKPMKTTYFLGRETLLIDPEREAMAVWRRRLFAFLSHNARNPTGFFKLTPNRVVEMGAQLEL